MRHLLSFFVFLGLPALLQAQTFTALPVSLTFSYQPGNALPAAQTVAVKASSGTPNYTAVITGANSLWLSATPDKGKLPATLAVRVNPTSLAVGTYMATVVVTMTTSVTPVNIPVTLNVTAPLPVLSIGSTTLAFSSPPVPPNQTVKLSTTGSPLSFSVAIAGASWMQVSPMNGVLLPGSQTAITVTVDPTGLVPQTAAYTGKITILAPGATPASKQQTVSVTLTISSMTPAITSVWPSSIPLNAQATTLTIRGSNFYAASVASVTGIATPLVTNVLGSDVLTAVIPSTMLNMAGTLNVVVSNPAPGGSSSSSPVAVGASPTIQAVVNAASMQAGTVALGELVTLFGNNIGPTTPVVLTDANMDGFADTTIASTSVTVDGIAAPLIYASQNQITVQVPYEATLGAGKVISVSQGASPPSTATVTIGAHAPGLFTADGSGAGQLAALNFSVATSLYSINSSSSAAKTGDTVLLYLTGEGDYAITISPRTGYLVPANLPTYPQLSPLPTVTIGGAAAVVNYAGPVPGSILGLIQINAVVPAGAGTGAAIPVVVAISASATQAGTTLGLK